MTTSVAKATLVVMPDVVTTREAAVRLGVTPRQVQRLARDGRLVQLAPGVLDRTAVEQLLALTGRRRTPWDPDTAWAAIALLSGLTAPWMGTTQRSRLRRRLREIGPQELAERSRTRARVLRYAAHPSSIDRLRPHVVEPSGEGLALTPRTSRTLDGYVACAALDRRVREHGLAPEPGGRITLRATSMPMDVVREIAARPLLAAVDVMGSLDDRERRAGTDMLESALEAFRG